MNHALATRNYDGTFFHLSEGRVETMRIVHRVRAGRVTERLQSLDGSGREFVRNNDELTCYLPDQHTVLVEPRPDHGPFLGSLAAVRRGRERVLPHRVPARYAHPRPRRRESLPLHPKDQFRFGYRLWLDEKTAMPLKTQLCDSRGQVIEQIFFARLDMPESIPDSDLAPAVRTEGMRWVRQGPVARQCLAGAVGLPRQRIAAGIPLDGGRRADHRRGDGPGQPSGVLGRPGNRLGIRRSAAERCAGRRIPARAHPPNRPCRGWRGSVRDTPFPPSCRAIRSPRSARCPRRPWSSSLTRSNPPTAPNSLTVDSMPRESPRFLLYSRPGCGLCEEMLSELAALPEAGPFGRRRARRRCRRRGESALRPQDSGAAFRRRIGVPRTLRRRGGA